MDPIKRLSDLVELAKPRELPHSMTMEKCLQLLNEMHQMGTYYATKGSDEERAFVFYLRFISIVVEELPKHACYLTMSQPERHSLDVRTLNCMSTAEQLKRRIRQRYDREKELAELGQSTSGAEQNAASTSRATSQHQQPNAGQQNQPQELDHLTVPDQQLSPYVRCQAVSMQPIVFQRVIIPNNIPELFLAQPMDGNGVRFALLYGRLVTKSVIVSQLWPCSLDTISARNFRRFVPDQDIGEDLPIVGCICSSLAKACQSGFFRACQISEMVCIVCPPGPNRTVLLHLVNMSPSGGSPAHPSTMSSSGLPCAHQHITDSIMAVLAFQNVQQQQNGTTETATQHALGKSPAGAVKTKIETVGGDELIGGGEGGGGTSNGQQLQTNG